MALNQILLTKSPYYIVEVGAPGFTSEIELRIWNGSSSSLPTEPTYLIEKQSLSNTSTEVLFEINQLVNDYFEHKSNIYSLTGSNKQDSLWVNVQSFGGSVNRNSTWLAVDGYSDFIDGINLTVDDPLLISERIVYHYEDIPIRFPVYCHGTSKANRVRFRLGTSDKEIVDLTSLINSVYSYDKVQYVQLSGYAPGLVDNAVITDSVNSIISTITIVPMTCTKYTPHVVSFINRFGVLQEIPFGLVSKESISTYKQKYTRQLLTFSGGVPSYNPTAHQFKEYNSNVIESITLNTDYIDESLNDSIGELISSEFVWVTVDGITKPVTTNTNSLEYKKNVNEGLISYTIKFDYAFNKRNSIY